ncbi:MAG: hypothetical protein AB8B81_05730 [Halioglobus sp.]
MKHYPQKLKRFVFLIVPSMILLSCLNSRASEQGGTAILEVLPDFVEPRSLFKASATRKSVNFSYYLDIEALRSDITLTAPEGCVPLMGPTTITESGSYCLVNHIIAEGSNPSGIIISANDVSLDLMGRTVVSLDADTVTSGISASNTTGLIVKNGAVSGFIAGVWLRNVSNSTLVDLNLSGNQWRGIKANGNNINVSNTTIRNMEGHVNYKDSPPVAIDVDSSECVISNNIHGTVRPIFWNDDTGIVANGCTLKNNVDEGYPVGFCKPIRRAATITLPGTYCLQNDILMDAPHQDAMTLMSDDIDLDLNGFSILGPGGDTLGSGIRAETFKNVHVHHGLVSGFLFGVRIEEGENALVNNIIAETNSLIGIRVRGEGAKIINNIVREMYGLGGEYASSHTFGVEVVGRNFFVEGNTIQNMFPFREGEAVGIGVAGISLGGRIIGNRIEWDGVPKYGKTIGIWLDRTKTGLMNLNGRAVSIDQVTSNHIFGANYAFSGSPPMIHDDNVVSVSCDFWYGRDVKISSSSSMERTGFCPVALVAVEKAARTNPDDLAMQYRLADKYMTIGRYNDGAYIFTNICARGFHEACRRMDRYKETGRTFE